MCNELDELKVKHRKNLYDFVAKLFFVGVIGIITLVIDYKIDERKIKLTEIEQNKKITLLEQEHLKEFTKIVLSEDVGLRYRLSQYFAHVTMSKQLRKNWCDYYKTVENEYKKTTEKRDGLKAKRAELNAKVDNNNKLSLKEKILLSKQASILEKEIKHINSQLNEKIDFNKPIEQPNDRNIILSNFDLKKFGLDHKNSNLEGINLAGENLSGIDFTGANLKYAILEGANLQDTNFTNAKLMGTSFKGANLKNAVFKNANVSKANFQDSLNFSDDMIMTALNWQDSLGISQSNYSEN